ncbi:hypothetical protein H0H93_013053 [Arthromyces matolae]|nr:hypothetical protein H0H93_013053 [Arthromyces matolae]
MALRHPNTSKQVGLRIHPSVRILLGGHEVPVAEKPKVTFNEPSDALTNRNPTDQRVKHCKVFQESEEDFPSKSAPKSSGSVPHEFTLDTLLQEFAKMLVPLATNAKESSTSASASPTKPVADTPAKATPAVTPHVTVQEKPLATNANGSLKQQLEARLNNEYHSEVRDTIQAIFESLRDAEDHHVTTPSNNTASVSSSKGKAKAKESSESANITAPTSKNVVDSFNEVRSIEAAFSALESDFSFPASLDFIASHLIPGTPESSDSESSSISTHLAYTSRNHPIRFYEQALSALLTQLDSIESFGNEELRATRREVVSRVERALEELEKEVEGRFRTKLSKVAKAPVETSEDISAPAPSASPERTVSGPAPAAEPIAEEPSISQDAETVLEPVVETAAESTVVVPESAVETAANADAEPSTTTPEVTQAVEAHPSESSDLSPSEPSSPIVLVETSKPDSVIDDHESLSLSSSDATVKPVVIVEEEEVQEMAASDKLESAAFLLTQAELSDQKRPNHKDDDVASDWSEVEA